VGIPVRLTIGDKALAENSVEFKERKTPGKSRLVPMAGVVEACLGAVGAGTPVGASG
jgi:anticodon tRNA-binding protein